MDKATEAHLCGIRSYVDSVRIRREDACVESKDLLALGKFAQDDFFGAILLAFTYGRAKEHLELFFQVWRL